MKGTLALNTVTLKVVEQFDWCNLLSLFSVVQAFVISYRRCFFHSRKSDVKH